MKKKLFIFLLTLALGASMIGCGSNEETLPDDGNGTEIGDVVEDDTISDGAISDEEGDTDEDTSSDANAPAQKPAEKPNTGNPPSKPNTGNSTNKPNSGGNSSNSGSNTALAGSFEDIISGLYKTAGLTDLNTGFTPIDSENMAYYLGVNNLKIKQGIGSEPLMSSVAHSVVLIELEAGQDVSKAKTAIKNNVDGFKWVCVGVEAENILVDNIGNYVLLVMDQDAQNIMDAFKALGK